MVGNQSSRFKQNRPYSRPVSTLMYSLVELYSFNLSGCLWAVRLNALTLSYPKGFPIDEYNHLALERVKSTEVLIGQERVNSFNYSHFY